MLRLAKLLFQVVFLSFSLIVHGQQKSEKVTREASVSYKEKGLRPELSCDKNGDNWTINVLCVPTSSYDRYTWLIPSNKLGGQIQVCLTNGVQCRPIDRQIGDALSLPFFTTVSNALRGTDRQTRATHWPWSNTSFQSGSFSLNSAFNIPPNQDLFLQVVPLLYKENTNSQTAWLVNFEPIRVKLKTNGEVEKIE